MRAISFAMMLLASPFDLSAQEETLFKENIETGGFGGPVLRVTSIKGQSALMLGGRGGWILGHSLVLGGGGYEIVTEIDAPAGVLPLEGPLDIKFGYGGFEAEYVAQSNSLAHFTVYTLVGCGDLHFARDVGPVSQSTQTTGESDFIYVLEPAITGELNITTWFRFNAGVSYRMVFDVEQPGLNNSDFSGVTAVFTFKFGSF